MFRRMVNLNARGDAEGFFRSKGTVQGTQLVGIEVVHHQQDNIGIGIILIDKSLHLVRPVQGTEKLLRYLIWEVF